MVILYIGGQFKDLNESFKEIFIQRKTEPPNCNRSNEKEVLMEFLRGGPWRHGNEQVPYRSQQGLLIKWSYKTTVKSSWGR